MLGVLLLSGGSAAQAAGPPLVGETWAGEVVAGSARLHSSVNPNGLSGHYRFDYIAAAAYEANLDAGREGFFGAARVPAGEEAALGSGTTAIAVAQQATGLTAETAYRYRLVARNSAGTAESATLSLVTQGFGGGATLLDDRAWEMVSPVDKNGGEVGAPGSIFGGGVLQAAATGGAVTYSSAASFGAAVGAPPGSQYVSSRGADGWTTVNVSGPLLSGSYGLEPEGVPYQLFSEDLSRGLMLDPRRCGEGLECPRSYSLRAGGTPTTSPAAPGLRFAGASPDLGHLVLSTCAALTSNAIEVPAGEGCDPLQPNLYEWSGGALTLVNLLPGESQGTPGAALAAQSGAISATGDRVYFNEGGDLYLREGAQTKRVDEAVGGGGAFQTASADGSVAFFTKAGHLFRYLAAGGSSTDLTPPGGVVGVLGASGAGDYVYYQDGAALKLWHGGAATTVAPGAEAASVGDYPPATGSARVSAGGTKLAFVSTAPLTGYDNIDAGSGEPDSEVYLYDAAGPGLVCVSCNPTEGRPIGPSTIPGATRNGAGPEATHSYKPRAMVAGGRRLFFDSSDALALSDTNKAPDAYEWEAPGEGDCTRSGGCLALVSSGKAQGGAGFIDASSGGADAFFLTPRSLVGADPGSTDLYDAREGGGFPEPVAPIPCEGDSCQILPPEPVDPGLNTLIPGPGNPKVHYSKQRRHRRTRGRRRHGHHRHRRHRDERHGRPHGHRGRR